jgi:hypothetical protein
MGDLLKTPRAARVLGITHPHLLSLIRDGRMDPPGRDQSNHYLWSPSDIERARQALKTDRRRKQTKAK